MPHDAYLHEEVNTAPDILYDATDLVNEFFSISISRDHHKLAVFWGKSMKQINPFSRGYHICHNIACKDLIIFTLQKKGHHVGLF